MPDPIDDPTYLTPAQRIRTIAIGAVVSGLLSMAIVIATAKAGISPGVSPLVVLFGWIGFGKFLGARLRPFLSLLQVTGSGGVAVSAGVVFTAPIIQVLARQYLRHFFGKRDKSTAGGMAGAATALKKVA